MSALSRKLVEWNFHIRTFPPFFFSFFDEPISNDLSAIVNKFSMLSSPKTPMDSLIVGICFRIEVEIRLQVAEAESDDREDYRDYFFMAEKI